MTMSIQRTCTEDQLLKVTRRLIHEKEKRTQVFVSNCSTFRPQKFHKSELAIGRVLGRGGFCVVSQVSSVKLQDKECPRDKTTVRSYAIKELKQDVLKDTDTCINGIVDLAMEARWLSSIQHQNIITLHGVSAEEPSSRNYFIILDRLDDILTSRIRTWKKQSPGGISKALHIGGKKEKVIWAERLMAAHGVACALEFLHSQNVMHRDLKPDDVGFNQQGLAQLFDFGLARELPDPSTADKNGCYNMTSFTGTIRYMAPEVGLGKPCNEKTDVYSFGLLLYHILALEAPFDGLTVKSFPKFVFEKGARPVPDAKWPPELSSLMKQCWSASIRERPSMADVSSVLSKFVHT